MLRHTLFIFYMTLAPDTQTSENLELQECFKKSLEIVYAMNPADKAKNYTDAELRLLMAACSLIED